MIREGPRTTQWQASDARHRFSEVIDAAVKGEPQFVRRRDGREVVVVSREYFERTLPTLKGFLLTEGYASDGADPLEQTLADVRSEGGPFVSPRAVDLTE
jgi:prevent-host-death family protein